MDSQIQETTKEVTTTETAQPVAEVAADTQAATLADTTQKTQESNQATDTPQYQPNFKFKVYNEEKEIDEWLRPLVKDLDSEKKVRDFCERAYGVDGMRSRLNEAREQHKGVEGKYNQIMDGIETLRTHVSNDDFDSFFKVMSIPKERIYQWVARELQAEKLAPEEKQRYNEQMELRRERSSLQKDLQTYKSDNERFQIQAMETDLESALKSPEVNSIMQSFDARAGRVGAFRDRVINELTILEFTTGKTPRASEGVERLLGLMQYSPSQVNTPQGNPQPTQIEKPVIPNLKSKASISPVKKAPQSLQELRDFASKRIKEISA